MLLSCLAQSGEICPAYTSQILKIIERLLIGEEIFAVNVMILCAVAISAYGLGQYGSRGNTIRNRVVIHPGDSAQR